MALGGGATRLSKYCFNRKTETSGETIGSARTWPTCSGSVWEKAFPDTSNATTVSRTTLRRRKEIPVPTENLLRVEHCAMGKGGRDSMAFPPRTPRKDVRTWFFAFARGPHLVRLYTKWCSRGDSSRPSREVRFRAKPRNWLKLNALSGRRAWLQVWHRICETKAAL